MSYILEALKKSDQQRQRGTMPTLQAAQVTVVAPRRPWLFYYGLLAAALLGATIGWLRPWQPEQTPPGVDTLAAKPPIPLALQAAPAPPEMPGRATQQVLNATPAAQPVPGVEAIKPGAPASTGAAATVTEKNMPAKNANPADVARESEAIPVAELPLPIQQELPAMTIQLHAYSSNPGERLVSINFLRLREGSFLTPDLRLEQITPDGMIFSYKGYRFQRGAR